MAAGLREHVVAYFEQHHKLLEAGALTLLLADRQPLVLSRELIDLAPSDDPFVTIAMVEAALAERHRAPRSDAPRLAPDAATAGGAAPSEGFHLIREGFDGPPPAGQPIEVYRSLFHSRYRTLQRLFRGRPSLPNLRPIHELRTAEGEASIVALVREVRTTSQRHHLIVTLDDDSGSIEVLVPKDSPCARVAFLPDEVVGIRLSLPKERGKLPRADVVERPDVPAARTAGRSARGRRVLLLSDLHIGSRSFLGESWEHLVEFLEQRGPMAELARTIDYVVVAGDLVDGIGVYPRQERDLAISDIVEQYAELGRRLAELPHRLTVIAVPGNHDAVCPAEPQPSLPSDLARLLPPNVRILGNPSTFSLDGTVVQAYHGRSFDDLIPALPGASYARPTEVMKRMLQMRHLAPIYGDRTPLAPLGRDGLVVEPAPDLLVTGHAHTYGVDRYRGVLLVNASTWQAETEYQRMRNIVPVPARAAVVDLGSLGIVSLDFSQGTPSVVEPAA